MKLSEAFEGENSSLRKAFDNATMTTHNEAQKTVEEIVEEFDQMMHTGYHKDIKVWMVNILTTRDQQHKKEMEAVVSELTKEYYGIPYDGDSCVECSNDTRIREALKLLTPHPDVPSNQQTP